MKLATCFFLLIGALVAADHAVTISASSKDTWIAFRKVSFLDAHDQWRLLLARVNGSTGYFPVGSDEAFMKPPHAQMPSEAWDKLVGVRSVLSSLDEEIRWTAWDYRGDISFAVQGEPAAVVFEPCCGMPDGDEGPTELWLPAVRIRVQVDGKTRYQGVRKYSLNRGTVVREFSISVPPREGSSIPAKDSLDTSIWGL